ncbi:MAG: hypothetical protein IPG48_02000 [Saprospiraceae bacterium]|nr:hypothetical protein [Saprospiraceae bacterium]
MRNLKSIYSMFNDAMDQYDKAIHEVSKYAAGELRNIILEPLCDSPMITDDDINTVDAIYTNMVATMEKSENTLYVDHIAISGMVLDALFFKEDFELLDTLRSSRPFCFLTDAAKAEIKAILTLFEIHNVCQSDFVGNKLYRFRDDNNLPAREMTCSLTRQYKGLSE